MFKSDFETRSVYKELRVFRGLASRGRNRPKKRVSSAVSLQARVHYRPASDRKHLTE